MRRAIKNGTLIAEDEAVLPVTKREVFFNFSVYESLKVREGKALFVEEHLARFFESARILELFHRFSPKEIGRAVHLLSEEEALKEATIKLLLVGGEKPLYLIHHVPLQTYPAEYYRDGVSVITYRGERTIPRAKSNCLLLNYLASREAERRNALEALLVDRRGKATEGTRSNLFAVREGVLVTAEEDVLYGVTRKQVLEAAEAEGIPFSFEKIDTGALCSSCYCELFITSTSMGAMPIAEVDGVRAAPQQGEAFPLARRLHRILLRKEEEEIRRL
jgi:branched-chain amino acid aminotransferase